MVVSAAGGLRGSKMRLRVLPASGFCPRGFARFKPLKERSAFFQQWIDEGRARDNGMAGARTGTAFRSTPPRYLPAPSQKPRVSAYFPSPTVHRLARRAAWPYRFIRARPRPITTRCSRGPPAVAATLSALRPDAVHAHLRPYRSGVEHA